MSPSARSAHVWASPAVIAVRLSQAPFQQNPIAHCELDVHDEPGKPPPPVPVLDVEVLDDVDVAVLGPPVAVLVALLGLPPVPLTG